MGMVICPHGVGVRAGWAKAGEMADLQGPALSISLWSLSLDGSCTMVPGSLHLSLTSPRVLNSYKATESCLGPSDQGHFYSLKTSSWETENHALPS